MSCYRSNLADLDKHDVVAFEYRARTIFWKIGCHCRSPEWVSEGPVARGAALLDTDRHAGVRVVSAAAESEISGSVLSDLARTAAAQIV